MERWTKVGHAIENIDKLKGLYIRFEGHGIINGLERPRHKNAFYKITGADEFNLYVKGYRKKYEGMLPCYNWNQGCETITQKEFKTLPEYS